MIRRIVAFVVFIALIAGVSMLVYFNAQETSFRLTPSREVTLPLGMLMLGALVGRAREAYYAMCVWMAVTAAWYVLRFLWVSAGKAFSGRRVPTA